MAECSRCYGKRGNHSPFCSYHPKRLRVVGVAMHQSGMVLIYGDGAHVLVSYGGSWRVLHRGKEAA